jgi:glycolate oxidase
VTSELEAALPGIVQTDPVALERYREDRSGHRSAGVPLAVVHARSIEDVQTLCRIASASHTPVVPWGAGTGLAGGAVSGTGEIVLSLAGMDRILEISEENRLAVVQPGILNGDLNSVLADHGLWWAPDPVSKDISTVGGNIAMNAGGLLCAKYGVTREAVLALKVVLADGTLLEVGHRSVKGVTGYDLTALIIGSEGTLGIIVECTLKLRPAVPGHLATFSAYFDTVEDAAAAVTRVMAQGHVPAILEMMDAPTLEYALNYLGQEVSGRDQVYLVGQCDGGSAEDDARAIAAILTEAGGDVRVTADADEGEAMVGVRRAAFPGLESVGTVLVEDIAVPRDRMVEAFAAIRGIEAKHDVFIPTTCHAGDGNLHPTFVFQGDDVPQAVWDAANEMFSMALDLGGTLTGEHGIGLLKRAWLEEELGEEQFRIQRRIKDVFDPLGILNPGKVFAPDAEAASA